MQDAPVKLRTFKDEFLLGCGTQIETLVTKWRELLRTPEAWTRAISAQVDLQRESGKDLLVLGLSSYDKPLVRLATAGIIEVQLSNCSDILLWELPWEFLLTSATREFGPRTRRLIVLRHLCVPSGGEPRFPRPKRLAVVKSNPGYISDTYSDTSLQYEALNVSDNLNLTIETELHNLTIAELTQYVLEQGPDVIHLAGVDSLQARNLPGSPDPDSVPHPGMMFATDDGDVEVIDADRLAVALCPSR